MVTLSRKDIQIIFCLLLGTVNNVFAESLDFNVYVGARHCEGCLLIEADGDIQESTSSLLIEFLDSNNYDLNKDTTVILNSPGGSLISGIELGEIIRRNGFNTHIGNIELNESGEISISDGICASSCAYAFLGGKRRSMELGSKYGLHQFSTSSNALTPINQTIKFTQELLSDITSYVVKMGGSTEIASIAASTSTDSIDWLNDSQLLSLRVVNSNGLYEQEPWGRIPQPYPETWSVVSILPDGSKDRFIIICEEFPTRSIPSGHVRLILSQSKQLDTAHPYFGKLVDLPVEVYLEGRQVIESSTAQFYFAGPGHSMYSFEIPSTIINQSIESAAELLLRISYPSNFPPSFSNYDHPIPIEGLDHVLASFKEICTHI